MRPRLEIGGATDPGSVRSNNEDSFGYDENTGIFVLCDDVGGAAAGEVASRIAVQSILNHFRRIGTTVSQHNWSAEFSLAEAIRFANHSIQQDVVAAEHHAGMDRLS